MAQRHEDERRQEDPERGEGCARDATQHVADERRRREDRTGGDLANGDGVEELPVGQPPETIDEIVAKEGQEHVAASVEHRADLQEYEKQCREAHAGADSGRRRHATAAHRRQQHRDDPAPQQQRDLVGSHE